MRRRKHWGWGFEDEQQSAENLRGMGPLLRDQLGFEPQEVEEPVPLARVTLPEPRLEVPAALADICDTSVHERATHAQGKALADIVGALRGSFPQPARRRRAPARRARDRGGARVGGRTPARRSSPTAAGPASSAGSRRASTSRRSRSTSGCSTACTRSTRSRAARGSARARRARASRGSSPSTGMTMRFYPQSLEHSTLGGWVATRAGGHFATLWTHVDDVVESVRAITPTGLWQSPAPAGLRRRRLARPDAAGQRGDPRRGHRGVGARAAQADPPAQRVRALPDASPTAPRRCARSSRPGCTRATAG